MTWSNGSSNASMNMDLLSGFRFRISGFGFRVSGFEYRVSGFGSRVSGFVFQGSGFGYWVSGIGYRVSGIGYQVSGIRYRVSCFVVLVSGTGYGVSGFGSRISCFWFRVSGIGFRVYDASKAQPPQRARVFRRSTEARCSLFARIPNPESRIPNPPARESENSRPRIGASCCLHGTVCFRISGFGFRILVSVFGLRDESVPVPGIGGGK